MATVTAAVDHDVDDKIDTDYVREQLKDVDVSILFSCANSEGWQHDTFTGEDGKPFFIIKLSYEDIKKMETLYLNISRGVPSLRIKSLQRWYTPRNIQAR